MSDFQPFVEILILLATIAAIIYGPIKAVKVTRELDAEREKRARKYAILTDLMKTRQARIDPLHVGALNLIELEFYHEDGVIKAYRAYAQHLNSHFPTESEALDRHIASGDDLFVEMLYKIAENLEFKFDKRDLTRLGYIPMGLSKFHDNSHVNVHLMREVLEGKRAIPISNLVSSRDGFPPVPDK